MLRATDGCKFPLAAAGPCHPPAGDMPLLRELSLRAGEIPSPYRRAHRQLNSRTDGTRPDPIEPVAASAVTSDVTWRVVGRDVDLPPPETRTQWTDSAAPRGRPAARGCESPVTGMTHLTRVTRVTRRSDTVNDTLDTPA